MFKIKKIILLICLTFLLCGCSVDYDIIINKDLSVDESFTVVEKKEEIRNRTYANTFDELVKSVQSNTGMDSSRYLIKKYNKGSLIGAKVNRSYRSINEYVSVAQKNDLFTTETEYKNENGISTLTSKVIYTENSEFVAISYLIDAKINIKVPFEVLENNADSVDKENNIYTWNLKNYKKSPNSEDIKLVFDSNKKINSPFSYFIFVVVGVAIVGLIIIGSVVYKKSHKTLEI